VKVEFKHELSLGRLSATLSENCHGDSKPLIDILHFDRLHQKVSPDTAALVGAVLASRWCGDVLELQAMKISVDFGDAIRLLAPDARFVSPIDGYRRQLCEGRLDLMVAPAKFAAMVLATERQDDGLARLVTWGGEFVDQHDHNSAGYIAGEISTNANLLVPDWEVSVCLGLLVGGLGLRSLTVPKPERKHARNFERAADAMRIVGVQLRAAGATPRLIAPIRFREAPADAIGTDASFPVEIRV